MTSIRLFAVALLSGLLFVQPAHAAVFTLNQGSVLNESCPPSALGSCMVRGLSSSEEVAAGGHQYNFFVIGELEKKTKLTITYKATGVTSSNYLFAANEEKGGISWASLLGGTSSYLEGVEYKNINGATSLIKTLVISNNSDEAKNFAAYLLSAIVAEHVEISMDFSNVPLPPSVLLFASALVLMAGFAARKRIHGSV